jgi:hypothetical protein
VVGMMKILQTIIYIILLLILLPAFSFAYAYIDIINDKAGNISNADLKAYD